MTYATLMVHLGAGRRNGPVLSLTAQLAERYKAHVIGIAAREPVQMGTGDGYFTGEFVAQERDVEDEQLKMAETEFQDFSGLRPFVLEWRSIPTAAPISHVVAAEARSADLLITSICSGLSRDSLTHADTGDLIVRAGRPVLVVPDEPATSAFDSVVVAWADTRECRRAIVDALPILKEAERVTVVEIASTLAEARSRTKAVVAWLSRHRVSADHIVSHAGGSYAESLASIAAEHDADLIVAGAYGHNRLREWAFGGVTRDLLLRDKRCALLSH